MAIRPLYSVAISPNASQGIVVARYSHRLSRMWTWNVDTLEVTGFQGIKAGVKLLDVSPEVGTALISRSTMSSGKTTLRSADHPISMPYGYATPLGLGASPASFHSMKVHR